MYWLILLSIVFILVLILWAKDARLDWKNDNVSWSSVTMSQLEAHQKFTIAMADRAHLDPSCRKLLKHQLKILKAIGVVGNKEQEIIDVTPKQPRKRKNKQAQIENEVENNTKKPPTAIMGPKIKYADLDESNRRRGYRVMGDPEPESQPEVGFGLHQKQK